MQRENSHLLEILFYTNVHHVYLYRLDFYIQDKRPFYEISAKSAEPDQTPATDQVPHNLLTIELTFKV